MDQVYTRLNLQRASTYSKLNKTAWVRIPQPLFPSRKWQTDKPKWKRNDSLLTATMCRNIIDLCLVSFNRFEFLLNLLIWTKFIYLIIWWGRLVQLFRRNVLLTQAVFLQPLKLCCSCSHSKWAENESPWLWFCGEAAQSVKVKQQ